MCKKSPNTKQYDLFNTLSNMMCDRESLLYDDDNTWHSKFCMEAAFCVDEEIFKVLFTEGREDKKDGCPNVALRIFF